MRLGLGIAVFAGLVGGGYLAYHLDSRSADASQAALVEPESAGAGPQVRVMEAVRGALEQSFSTYGNLIASMEADIASQIDGQVETIPVKDGATVERGQIILTLDAAVAEADLQSAEARLKAAKTDFDRVQTLVQRGTSTPLALEQARVKLAVAQTDLALKQAERRRYTIRAPFAGQITQIKLTEGALVNAGKPISRIYDQQLLRVEFQVPERLWAKVQTGQSFTIRADGEATLTAKGKVTYVSPSANPSSRSLVVTGLIDNSAQHFASGLFVHVRLDLGAKEDVVLVPEAAIVERLSGSYVFIVEKDKSYERKVELGERRDGKVEVVSGIDAGAQVVVHGQKMIRDNMAVTVAQASGEG